MRADKLAHRIAERCGHTANLTFLPFDHDDFESANAVTGLDHLDKAGRGPFAFDEQAAAPLVQRGFVGRAIHVDQIRLGVSEARVRDFLREFAIIGQHDEPFTVGVQAPDREQALLPPDHVDDRFAVVGAVGFVRHQNVARFVHCEIQRALVEFQLLAIQFNDIGRRVGFLTQLGNHAVDANAPPLDILFGGATRRDIRLCQ